jgi:hypothetical protein
MDNSRLLNTKEKLQTYLNKFVQASFLSYAALFAVVGLVSWLSLHYGTDWFKDASTNTVRIWEQAGVAFAVALTVCLIAFFGKLL